jgi:hypothetical protein
MSNIVLFPQNVTKQQILLLVHKYNTPKKEVIEMFYYIQDIITGAYENLSHLVVDNMLTICVTIATITLSFVTWQILDTVRVDKEWVNSPEALEANLSTRFLQYQRAVGNTRIFW